MFGAKICSLHQSASIVLFYSFSLQSKQLQPDYVSSHNTRVVISKGSRKNKFAELALRFSSDLADPIEQNRRTRSVMSLSR